MNKNRLCIAFLSVVLLVTLLFSFTVFAAPDDVTSDIPPDITSTPDVSEYIPDVSSGVVGDVSSIPPESDIYEPEPSALDPESNYYGTPSYNEEPVYSTPPVYTYDDEGNEYYTDYDPELEVSSIAGHVEMYEVPKKNNKDLKESNWSEITLNAAGSTGGNGDFSQIKSNNGSGDNGHWILFAGFSLIVCSIIGIGYVVISSVKNKSVAYSYGDRTAYSANKSKGNSFKSDTAEINLPRKSGARYSNNKKNNRYK